MFGRATSIATTIQPAPSRTAVDRVLVVALAAAIAAATLLSSWAAGSARALSLPGVLPPIRLFEESSIQMASSLGEPGPIGNLMPK